MTVAGTTTLVGLIRDPLAQSLSPQMQNAAFAARGLDWAYVPLGVAAADLEVAFRGLAALGFAGANVTMPHKLAAVSFCDELDEAAERAASVNTITVREGRLLGASTDGEAVTGAVETEAIDALVVGAGGAAQAVATALAGSGLRSLRVTSRSEQRAGALVARLRTLFPALDLEAVTWPGRELAATLVVNATPLKEEWPFEIDASQQIADLAYKADGGETELIRLARAAGCTTVVDGLEVLVRQGAAAFELWTGLEAPIEVMRAAVRG